MPYIEVSITGNPFGISAAECLPAWLDALGFESYADQPEAFLAYIHADRFNPAALHRLFARPALRGLEFTSTAIDDANWNETWESNFNPVWIDEKCLIRAPFHRPENARYELIIAPKMAFGTGHHATTAGIITEMMRIDITGLDVLDAGCGTGILSVLACKMGAATVTAIDEDPVAIDNAKENLSLNLCGQVMLRQGNISLCPLDRYHLVLANINLPVLVASWNRLAQCLTDNGILLVSGILASDFKQIEELGILSGLVPISTQLSGEWTICRFEQKKL